jgi:hypothetical protein
MNGPTHYEAAESELDKGYSDEPAKAVCYLLSALAHAVLALCAAHVENDAEVGRTEDELDRWVFAGAVEDVAGSDLP